MFISDYPFVFLYAGMCVLSCGFLSICLYHFDSRLVRYSSAYDYPAVLVGPVIIIGFLAIVFRTSDGTRSVELLMGMFASLFMLWGFLAIMRLFVIWPEEGIVILDRPGGFTAATFKKPRFRWWLFGCPTYLVRQWNNTTTVQNRVTIHCLATVSFTGSVDQAIALIAQTEQRDVEGWLNDYIPPILADAADTILKDFPVIDQVEFINYVTTALSSLGLTISSIVLRRTEA